MFRKITGWLAAIAATFVVTSAWATTLVLPTEDQFIASSDIIATVIVDNIVSIQSGDQITTQIDLRTLRSFKGSKAGAKLTIYQPGGRVGNSIFWVDGSPEYSIGRDALVFIKQLSDGTLTTNTLSLGYAPLQVNGGGETFLGHNPLVGGQLLGTFQDRLRSKILGASRKPIKFSFRRLEGSSSNHMTFNFMNPPSRWRQHPVQVWGPTVPDQTLGAAASARLISGAMNAWNTAPDSDIDLKQLGVQEAVGMKCITDRLSISFNDPFNSIQLPDNCSGILALGGFCASSSAQNDGFFSINGGALTIADGWERCSFWTEANIGEVMTHELGHTIGLAHSSESGQQADAEEQAATMFWMAHFDGRGTSLKAYDQGAIAALYPDNAPAATTTPKPTPTKTPIPVVTPTRTPAATATPLPPNAVVGDVYVYNYFYPVRTTVVASLRTSYLDLSSGLIVRFDRIDNKQYEVAAPESSSQAAGSRLSFRTRTDSISAASTKATNKTTISFQSTSMFAGKPGALRVALTGKVRAEALFSCKLMSKSKTAEVIRCN